MEIIRKRGVFGPNDCGSVPGWSIGIAGNELIRGFAKVLRPAGRGLCLAMGSQAIGDRRYGIAQM
jgi:hypothetical protein